MGHRALIAYERPDGQYNVHYSHWGACQLRLKHEIRAISPLAGDEPAPAVETAFADSLRADTVSAAEARLKRVENAERPIDPVPTAVGLTLEDILTAYLDYLHHEAFYLVDAQFDVTAYRTHWFGLQYDCETVTEAPTIGNGALRTVRWYDGEPVGDGYAKGEFNALKHVVGDLIDREVFAVPEAVAYLEQMLETLVDRRQELLIHSRSEVTE